MGILLERKQLKKEFPYLINEKNYVLVSIEFQMTS